jgi:hypothetical protein
VDCLGRSLESISVVMRTLMGWEVREVGHALVNATSQGRLPGMLYDCVTYVRRL